MTEDATRAYLLSIMDERDRRYDDRFKAQEKAVLVAFEQMKIRFDNVNEWRGTVTDLLNNSIPRREADTRSGAMEERINLLQSRLDKLEGRGVGIGAFWSVISRSEEHTSEL